MANNINLEETAHPDDLDLPRLQNYVFWSTELKANLKILVFGHQPKALVVLHTPYFRMSGQFNPCPAE